MLYEVKNLYEKSCSFLSMLHIVLNILRWTLRSLKLDDEIKAETEQQGNDSEGRLFLMLSLVFLRKLNRWWPHISHA